MMTKDNIPNSEIEALFQNLVSCLLRRHPNCHGTLLMYNFITNTKHQWHSTQETHLDFNFEVSMLQVYNFFISICQ